VEFEKAWSQVVERIREFAILRVAEEPCVPREAEVTARLPRRRDGNPDVASEGRLRIAPGAFGEIRGNRTNRSEQLRSEIAITDLMRVTGARSRELDGRRVHLEFVKWVHEERS
jgi:hypothetical protein